jgi:hypothetical protein
MANPSEPWLKTMHTVYDHAVGDAAEARELAHSILREKSFEYLRAEGTVEGDQRLKPGATVTMKNFGKKYSGEYIASAVIHRFSLEDGYTTDFCLKRNMLDEEFMRRPAHTHGGAGAAAPVQSRADQGESTEEEEENGPAFRSLKWKKASSEITEALVDDEVTIFFEVVNIDAGETVNVEILEYDDDGRHDHIEDLTGEVKNGRVEIPWTVEYHEDNDDTNSAREIEEQGYTLPEYFFVAEYNGTESEGGEKKLLYVKGWTDHLVKTRRPDSRLQTMTACS